MNLVNGSSWVGKEVEIFDGSWSILWDGKEYSYPSLSSSFFLKKNRTWKIVAVIGHLLEEAVGLPSNTIISSLQVHSKNNIILQGVQDTKLIAFTRLSLCKYAGNVIDNPIFEEPKKTLAQVPMHTWCLVKDFFGNTRMVQIVHPGIYEDCEIAELFKNGSITTFRRSAKSLGEFKIIKYTSIPEFLSME